MQILTIDVGGTTALFELQLAGHTEQYKIPTGEGFKIEELNNQIAALERDYDLQDYQLAIGVPGLVQNNRLVACKSLPGLNGLSFDTVKTQGELKFICNDMDAGMQATCDAKYACELLVMCGTGIGMSIAFNGQAFTGATGVAGELGHCRVMTESGEFSLEQLASGDSVRSRNITTQDDLYRAGSYLGMGLAWTVNLFNPNRIWLAGNMMNSAPYYKGCLESLKQMALSAPLAEMKINRVDDMETLVCRGLSVMIARDYPRAQGS
ncbi:ROK family protein [Shewanella baltica]|uniref:ROK family protein n=1 Tax=Shewanella baltica TaxID=62322 RepID=UPI00217E7187|nr:ROK family protein [Shewanella baltica]MCS6153062.1 ROK family protein [Shewanella baltica]